MNMNPMEAFNIGKSLKKNPVASAIGGALDEFGTADQFKRKMALEYAKSQFMSPKDVATTKLLNKKSESMDGMTGNIPQGMVLDRISPQGPTWVNRQNRIEMASLSSQAQQLPKLDRAFDAVQQLKNQYNSAVQPISITSSANPLQAGMQKAKQGFKGKLGAATGTNPQLNRYLANRGGFASLISKGGFLEAGVLTEGDIKRVLAVLPSEFSTKEEADIAWNEVENILGGARKRFEAQSGMGNISNTPTDSTPGSSTLEADKQQLKQAIASGDYDSGTIKQMIEDFSDEYPGEDINGLF